MTGVEATKKDDKSAVQQWPASKTRISDQWSYLPVSVSNPNRVKGCAPGPIRSFHNLQSGKGMSVACCDGKPRPSYSIIQWRLIQEALLIEPRS